MKTFCHKCIKLEIEGLRDKVECFPNIKMRAIGMLEHADMLEFLLGLAFFYQNPESKPGIDFGSQLKNQCESSFHDNDDANDVYTDSTTT